MSAQSVISRITRVAAGAFAPGHLGELTQIVPFDMIDAVLAETAPTAQQRIRLLPARVTIYFLLAMNLFPELGYRGVWSRLTAGLTDPHPATPTSSALRQARTRIGPRPLAALFDLLTGPIAWPRTTGACWRDLRPVAIDGTGITIPDSTPNRAWAATASHPAAGYPMLRLLTLVECGTRALIGAVFGSPAHGELAYATTLVNRLRPGMVLLADRNFDAATFLTQVAATGADLLIRLKANRRPPLTGRHPDGSITSIIGGIPVRIVEALITVTTADGSRRHEHYRLVTTLLDPQRYPATDLIELYHQRWEIETAYLALKHTILRGRVLRSHTPAGVEQELWALLVTYQVLRIAMADATGSRPGIDPDRAGFSVALHAARDQVITARSVIAGTRIDLVGTIGAQVLAGLLPARRARICPRTVKRPLSKYAYSRPGQPHACLKADIHVTVTDAAASPLTRPTPP